MKRFIQLLLLFFIIFMLYCENTSGNDKNVIRELLDINGLTNVEIDDIVFWKNGRIVELYTTDLHIVTIPDSINNLTSLKFAHFTNNLIKKIPDNFCDLKNLQGLHISGNPIEELPDCIGNLTNLQTITLYGHNIKKIPDSFLHLPHLTVVSFESMAINSVPKQLLNKQVQQLFISGYQLETIPDEIGTMENLESLTVKGIFNTIPESISHLKRLKSLTINGKGIKTIPAGIYDIIMLEELDLQRNDFEYLPEGISRLINLRDLKLSHNRLTALPSDVYTTTQWGKVIDGRKYDIDIRDNRICHVTAEQDAWLTKYVSKEWKIDQYCP
ncbi:MAG: leucine-rich repeat domain-containing protein [Spirochaetales bacterium]|nr:leucine-rich repeat domain-containing protein [Spirochaetales bacterium]